MKKIYLYLFLIGITVSCEKQELIPQQEESLATENQSHLKLIDYQNLPLNILYSLDKRNLNKSREGDGFPFGRIRKDMAVKKIVNKEGKVSYTMVLETVENSLPTDPSAFYFDNLVIHEKDKGDNLVFVLRYIPTAQWNNNSRDFKDFSGTVIFYRPTGEKINSFKMTGEEIYEGAKSNRKAECTLEMERGPDFCVGDVEETASGEVYGDGEETCYPTYTYKWTCTMGGGGDDDYQFSDPYPDEPDGLPRTGGTTSPTYPEDEVVQIVNALTDPCASLVFNQLHLLSMDHNLPPKISFDTINGLETDLHFTEAILNVFNDSQKFDYFVQEDQSMSSYQTGATDPSAVWNAITEKYEITSTFNPEYFKDATDLSIARTIIHESVHAFLIYHVKNEPIGDIKDALTAYIESNGLSNQVNNVLHHNFMSQFVNSIAYNLYLWDSHHGSGGNLGWQYYHDMAWGGLGKYKDKNGNILFYQEYLDHTTAAERTRIDNTIQDEAQNTSQSSQSGIKNNCQ